MKDKINLWSSKTSDLSLARNAKQEDSWDEEPEDCVEYSQPEDGELEDIDVRIPNLHEARMFLFQGEAYRRLLRRIHAAANLSSRQGHVVQEIRETILSSLSTHRPELLDNSSTTVLPDSVSFEVAWAPRLFLEEQYPAKTSQNIESIITLTGSSVDAQAARCCDYICQIWPGIGKEILHAIQATTSSPKQSYECELIPSIQILNAKSYRSTVGEHKTQVFAHRYVSIC